jgi:hypothetical protein
MKLTDSRGLPVSTQSAAALEHYELAAEQTHGYFGNPQAALDDALDEDPDFAAAHALRADLAVMSSEQGALPLIQESVDALERIGSRATPREQAHVAAARAWLEGRFELAAHRYGAIAIEHPRDLIAIQSAHAVDFYSATRSCCATASAQALPYWNQEVPGYGYLLGMHAFGLEETGNYGRAEDVGRHALALNPRDACAVHAVEHVFEMQGRVHDGTEWLNATAPNWADTGFAVHLWWHLALLSSATFRPRSTSMTAWCTQEVTTVSALVDATQLLARIALRGGTVGTRWHALADGWSQTSEGGFFVSTTCTRPRYALAGRGQDINRMLTALEKARAASGRMRRMCARSACRLRSRSSRWRRDAPRRRWNSCCRSAAALPHRRQPRSARPGAAHGDRRGAASGNGRLARALVSERTETKPASPHNWRLMARALESQGATTEARKASEHAELRRRAQLRRTAA